jgi:hypothetical protein
VNVQGVQRLPPMTTWFQQHMMFFNNRQRKGCRKKIESAHLQFYEAFPDYLLRRNSMIPIADATSEIEDLASSSERTGGWWSSSRWFLTSLVSLPPGESHHESTSPFHLLWRLERLLEPGNPANAPSRGLKQMLLRRLRVPPRGQDF